MQYIEYRQSDPLHTMLSGQIETPKSVPMFIGLHTIVKTMKRSIALLICLLMMTVSLTGCLGGDDEESPETPETTPSRHIAAAFLPLFYCYVFWGFLRSPRNFHHFEESINKK